MRGTDWFSHSPEPPGEEPPLIHESAYIDEPCQIGHGTRVMHFAHIMPHSVIGPYCLIGHNVTVDSGVLIGQNVHIHNNTTIHGGVILEDNVYCGPSTVFLPLKHVRGGANNISSLQPTLVRQGANIGANTTIAAGFTIGQYAFVESGSVIDGHVPDFALVYGNPFQLVGWRCDCGQMLKFLVGEMTACSQCGQKYTRRSEVEIIPLGAKVTHDPHLQSHPTIRSFKTRDT